MKEFKIKVYGRVQGVNFRVSIKRFCDSCNLKGYVTNLDDGSVEIVVQCSRDELDKLIEFVKNDPSFSKVKEVKVFENNFGEKYNDFVILRSGGFFGDQGRSARNFGKSLFR